MEFVLDNQGRGRSARSDAEQPTRIVVPRDLRELVDGADQDRRRVGVYVFVDHQDRETAAGLSEAALWVGADERHRPRSAAHGTDFLIAELGAVGEIDTAPRALQNLERI